MYTIRDYGNMIADKVRMDAFLEALRQAVKPSSVVVDIGTGTGIFALLACQLGARRVYAIEPDDAIQVARQIAAANRYAERIEFIRALSTQITLPERADVIVSDLGGILPWFKHHISSIVDARKRFLAPGGVLVPQRDTLYATVVEASDLHQHLVGPWDENRYGLDMQAARQIVVNTLGKGDVMREQFLTESQCWATLDYAQVASPNVSAEIVWTVSRAGAAHGLTIWFDRDVSDGVHLSNAPSAAGHTPRTSIYGAAFLPWPTPVSLSIGDTVSVALRADLVGEDYVWSWDTGVFDQGDPTRLKADFKQSTFFGAPLSVARLHKQDTSHIPNLNEDGKIDRFILSSMDGKTSLTEIACKVSDRFPKRFTNWEDALTRVGRLSQAYSG
jgi:protein arginine N-methyltransferase 1